MPRKRTMPREEVEARSRTRYKFTDEQRSSGGAEARWRERTTGKKLNHNMLFGKKVKSV